ncbi:MAG: hypothetical protein ACYDHH_02185 [Solirubrobacteraceae bacterium]
MTGRCYDFPGPRAPVIATSDGWLRITEGTARDVARSGMLLACGPEHVDALREQVAQHALATPASSSAARSR